MALRTFVKISNVTNLSDARYCAGMGVDMLGFSMDADSPDYVDPQKFNDIKGWVAGVQIVGETTSTNPGEISQLLDTYQPDALQVDEAALLTYLRTSGRVSDQLGLILRLDLSQLTLDQLQAFTSTEADYVLLESPAAVHLDDELKAAIRELAGQANVLLGTGLSADNVHEIIAELPVKGIALRGDVEEKPGNKEFGELMDILEAIEED